jgi:hypothetical protein
MIFSAHPSLESAISLVPLNRGSYLETLNRALDGFTAFGRLGCLGSVSVQKISPHTTHVHIHIFTYIAPYIKSYVFLFGKDLLDLSMYNLVWSCGDSGLWLCHWTAVNNEYLHWKCQNPITSKCLLLWEILPNPCLILKDSVCICTSQNTKLSLAWTS